MVLPLSAIFFFGYLFGHFAEIEKKIMYIEESDGTKDSFFVIQVFFYINVKKILIFKS